MLGLIGSLHCAGMCGPLVLALPCDGKCGRSFVQGRILYNLGRISTYSVLGVVFGLIGKSFALAGLQRAASILAGVAILIACFGLRKLDLSGGVYAWVRWVKTGLGKLMRQKSPMSLFALGLLNGLLPCGLVYVACASSIATGSVMAGGLYMFAFGLGTLPMMFGIGFLGRNVQLTLRLRFQKLIPISLAVLGFILILRGMSLGIPYLSPDLAASSQTRCH